MAIDASELLVIGKITTVFGVKGWVKIHSFTEPMENFLGYQDFYLERSDSVGQSEGQGNWRSITFSAVKRQGKGLIALIEGVDDREQARLYCQCNIATPRQALPELQEGEFYWNQLHGLEVKAKNAEGCEVLLGKVHHVLETGANDVLVVRKSKGSIDEQERLIPWLPDQVVIEVDIEAGFMRVDWDPEF